MGLRERKRACLVGNLFSKIPVCEEIIMQAPNLGYVLSDDCGHIKLEYQMYYMMNLYQIKIYISKGNP